MKCHYSVVALVMVFLSTGLFAQTNTGGLQFRADRKRFDIERSEKKNTKVKEEKWGYSVTIENRAFKDFQDIEVRYILFAEEEVPGKRGTTKALKTRGTKTIESLKNTARFQFETDPVKLTEAELSADLVWTDGSKQKSKSSLTGIWLRVYAGGEMISEFVAPPALAKKEKWED